MTEMTEINEIIIAIQRTTLVPNKNRRGETVFNFQDHFLKDLERRVAAFIEKETGQPVVSGLENTWPNFPPRARTGSSMEAIDASFRGFVP